MSLSAAYKTSSEIFKQLTVRYQPALWDELKGTQKGDITVVKGDHDHVEVLFDTMKLPYNLIEPEDIEKKAKGRVLIVNCKNYGGYAGSEDYDGSKVPKGAVEAFVHSGGRLVTTDWALNFARKAFPGRFTFKRKTTDDVVEIQASTDIGRRLIGLNYAQCHPQWWLEGSSDIYEIGQGVTPIITSKEMEQKYGSPYVAAGFPVGKGEVIHFISHLELQRTRLKGKKDKSEKTAEGLEAFLKNMGADKTAEMNDAHVAELEAAYSTLNTLAHLCSHGLLLQDASGGKSVMTTPTVAGTAKSKKLM